MGTLTITTTGAQDARLVVAYKRKLNLASNATAAQIKAEVIRMITQDVLEAEKAAAREAAEASITPIDPT